jgi:hypothetical protein
MMRALLLVVALSALPSPQDRTGRPGVSPTTPTLHWFHPARSPCPAFPFDPTDAANLKATRDQCNADPMVMAWGACVEKQGAAVPSC